MHTLLVGDALEACAVEVGCRVGEVGIATVCERGCVALSLER